MREYYVLSYFDWGRQNYVTMPSDAIGVIPEGADEFDYDSCFTTNEKKAYKFSSFEEAYQTAEDYMWEVFADDSDGDFQWEIHGVFVTHK